MMKFMAGLYGHDGRKRAGSWIVASDFTHNSAMFIKQMRPSARDGPLKLSSDAGRNLRFNREVAQLLLRKLSATSAIFLNLRIRSSSGTC